jgi:hypothetical protein
MDKRHDTALDGLMEQLIESGAENIGTVFARLFELMGWMPPSPSVVRCWSCAEEAP